MIRFHQGMALLGSNTFQLSNCIEFYFILPLKMWFSNVQFFKGTTWILLHAFCAYCITCCPITESWFSNVQFFKGTTWILFHAFCAYCITCCPITESSCRVFCGSIFTGHQHTEKIAWKLNQATATTRLVFVSSAPAAALTDGFGFSEEEKSSKRRDEFTNE